MKISPRPMLITIGYGLLCGLLFGPLSAGLSHLFPWPVSFRLIVWVYLALYIFMLTRWKKASPLSITFPLLLLLMLVFWGDSDTTFLFFALGILSWIRSGVSVQGSLLKVLSIELLICVGGGALVAYFSPHSMLTWALAMWMFFLIQSLYFFFFGEIGETEVERDPFDQARGKVERILSGGHW
jgi:hypothetical protein